MKFEEWFEKESLAFGAAYDYDYVLHKLKLAFNAGKAESSKRIEKAIPILNGVKNGLDDFPAAYKYLSKALSILKGKGEEG